ncbi:MAG: conserved exported protein of unknown function [Nitrospira sp.]|nr:MAG: conserved exported protein of unknown function [Nitrospira sp.]
MHLHTTLVNIALRSLWLLALCATLSACGTYGGEQLFVVGPEHVHPDEALGAKFGVKGSVGYDRIWDAAVTAMSKDMTIIESHKPTGTIKSRIGAAPSGKIVGFWITPTTPQASQYTIDTMSIKPIGFNSRNGRGWEPAVVDHFFDTLGTK